METHKKIDLSLDEERELYNSDNETMIKLALRAFPEKDLKFKHFSEITTFEDAVGTIGMNLNWALRMVEELETASKASAAMFKLNIIRKALNLGQDLHLTKDPEDSYIYYPYNPFVTKSPTYYKSEINSGKMEVIGKIKSKGEEYNVLCGNAFDGGQAGFGNFYSDVCVGKASASVGYLGCVNEDIAKHFGKYFGMLITESKYGDMIDFNIIEDKYGCTQ